MPQPQHQKRLIYHTGTASTTQSGARQATMRLSLKPAPDNRVFHCAAVRSRPASVTCSNPKQTLSSALHMTCATPTGITTQRLCVRTCTNCATHKPAGLTACSRVQQNSKALRCSCTLLNCMQASVHLQSVEPHRKHLLQGVRLMHRSPHKHHSQPCKQGLRASHHHVQVEEFTCGVGVVKLVEDADLQVLTALSFPIA